MRIPIERLRSWILIVSAVLLAGIVSFLGYARWQLHRIGHDLPGKLGISIQQTSNDFTFSKSQGGHTFFSLHAAKMVQYKASGHYNLHDVSITLYGANGAPSDRIYGNDFDYDPTTATVRANGAVQIDLQAPPSSSSGTQNGSSAADEGDNKDVVHIKTSDLVFNQKTGFASTTQRLEFRLTQAAGSAVGASFDSASGVVILQSEVAFNSSINGNALAVRANHAQYNRDSQLLYLLQDAADYVTSHGSSDQATVHFRKDGSASRLDAQGHVLITGSNDQRITSSTARVDMDDHSQPTQATLDGGLVYVAADAARQMRGEANSGVLSFGPQAEVRHAQLRNAVSLVANDKAQPAKGSAGKDPAKVVESTSREIRASQVDVNFGDSRDGETQVRDILGTGDASMNIRTLYAATPPQETTVQGDQLFATLQDGVVLSSVRGTGHTKLTLLNPDGVKQTSTGDNLLMTFAPAARQTAKAANKKQQAAIAQPAAQLQTSLQQGNVTLTQTSPAKPASSSGAGVPDGQTTATAQKATYDASTQLMRLEGDPRIHDASGELSAGIIEFERMTGNATASGGVKATYEQSGSQPGLAFGGGEPVHVVADHAHQDHASTLTVFYGKAHADARLWQGADSVSAPVLELSRTRQTLSAHGASASDGKPVTAIFTSLGGGMGAKPAQTGKSTQPSVVRVNSKTLLYSDAQNKGVFRGGVVAQNSSGTICSSQMEIYFTSASATPVRVSQPLPSASQQTNTAGKQVERIVALGGVQLEQPGRKATGEQLVYTAEDGRFVLTGSSSEAPHISDVTRGTVTGSSLIFNDHDDSVIVSGGQSKAITETRTAK